MSPVLATGWPLGGTGVPVKDSGPRSSLRGPVVVLVIGALVGSGPGHVSHTCETVSWHITYLTAPTTSCHNEARFKDAMESARLATFCVTVWKAAICLSWTETSWVIAVSLCAIFQQAQAVVQRTEQRALYRVRIYRVARNKIKFRALIGIPHHWCSPFCSVRFVEVLVLYASLLQYMLQGAASRSPALLSVRLFWVG